jgi:hypothetical protein
MMTTMKMKLFLSTCLAFALLACSNSDTGGNGRGDEGLGGGVIEVQQVQLMVDDIVSKVSAMPEIFPEVNIDQLVATTKKVEIIGRKKTFANDTETDATNNGSSRIEINMTRWNKLKNFNRKSALILHELLGIMGIEKNNYSVSSRLLYEHRFGPERTYTCIQDGATATCQIVMQYDHSQDGFLVDNRDCGNFPRQAIVLYRPYTNYFSSTNYCPQNLLSVAVDGNQPVPQQPVTGDGTSPSDPVSEEEQLCQVQSGTGEVWDSLYFKNGYAFHFLGVRESQLSCRLD